MSPGTSDRFGPPGDPPADPASGPAPEPASHLADLASDAAHDAAPGDERRGNVIALSSYRARLSRGKRARRSDVLMASADPEQAVRALPGDELYYLLREDDPREAKDLLAYATPEQVQVVLDFALWSGSTLVPGRLQDWVETIAEMPVETIGRWLRGIDTELFALMIRKGARIYDLTLEEAPDEPQGIAYTTPDRFFLLDVTGYRLDPGAAEGAEGEGSAPGASAEALVHVIDSLYRTDLNLARRILVGAKAELDSELEELALRWRQGRMSDLGFVDPIEALEIYRELDPTSVRIGEVRPGTRLRPHDATAPGEPPDLLRTPVVLAEALTGSSPFARALARVPLASELEELHFALVSLANRVLAADRVDAADDAAVAASLARMGATLDLAIEFLARGGGGAGGRSRDRAGGVPSEETGPGARTTGALGAGDHVLDEDRAVDALRTIPLFRLFRLGVSLVGKVRKLGLALRQRGPFAAVTHLDLVEEPEATVLGAATRVRPLYAAVLDDPPAARERPFASLADVARATAAIERAAVAQALLLGLGVRPEHLRPEALAGAAPADRAEIDAGVVARTALVLRLLDREGAGDPRGAPTTRRPRAAEAQAFRPLTSGEVAAFEGRPSAGRKASKPSAAPATASTAAKRRPPAPRAGDAETKRGGDGPTGRATEALRIRARALLEHAWPEAGGGPQGAERSAVLGVIIDRWLSTLWPLEPVLVRD